MDHIALITRTRYRPPPPLHRRCVVGGGTGVVVHVQVVLNLFYHSVDGREDDGREV